MKEPDGHTSPNSPNTNLPLATSKQKQAPSVLWLAPHAVEVPGASRKKKVDDISKVEIQLWAAKISSNSYLSAVKFGVLYIYTLSWCISTTPSIYRQNIYFISVIIFWNNYPTIRLKPMSAVVWFSLTLSIQHIQGVSALLCRKHLE